MKPKKIEKFAILLIGLLLLLPLLYLTLCPVRTLGEILEQKGISLNNHDAFSILPVAWSELADDVLGVRTKLPSELDVYSEEMQEKEKVIALLDSLKVRKKLGKSHEFSVEHENESGYEYWVSFIGPSPIDFRLCEQEVCFETSPQRYSSFDYNTYLLVDCPENKRILEEILNFLIFKIMP